MTNDVLGEIRAGSLGPSRRRDPHQRPGDDIAQINDLPGTTTTFADDQIESIASGLFD